MPIDQAISDFVTGAERIGSFFEGLDKLVAGSSYLEELFFGEGENSVRFTSALFDLLSADLSGSLSADAPQPK